MAIGRFFALPLLFVAGMLAAAEQQPPVAYIVPGTVDADFPFQGEYVGKLIIDGTEQPFGVQILAQGDGKFAAVGYRGGLPGDGWDKSPVYRGKGQLEGMQLKLENDQAIGVVSNKVLTIHDRDGNKLGELTHTIRQSPTLGAKPTDGAVVLFDGKINRFPGSQVTEDGLLKQGASSEVKFQSGTLHLEFLLSYMPKETGQRRANSGCYLQGRYETQILDSFALEGKDNECGGIYSIKDPDVNLCFPPLSWQTYDIDFTAAKYDSAGKKTTDAKMTVRHNGVIIHQDVPLPKTTTAAPVKDGPEPGPIYLQDHGNPIRFRNIWFVERK